MSTFVAHWEYAWDKADPIYQSAVTSMLAARGQLGWELVSVIRVEYEGLYFFFKRRIYSQAAQEAVRPFPFCP